MAGAVTDQQRLHLGDGFASIRRWYVRFHDHMDLPCNYITSICLEDRQVVQWPQECPALRPGRSGLTNLNNSLGSTQLTQASFNPRPDPFERGNCRDEPRAA